MNLFYKLPLLFLFSSSVSLAYAQTDTTTTADTSGTEKSHLKIGVSYVNNSVYLGRTDTITTPGITPTISYTLKSGLYFSGAMDFVTNRKKNTLDGGNLEIGYDHSFTDDFEGGLSLTKLFYNSNSTQVSSSLSSVITAYADYDIADIITPAVLLSYNIDKSSTGSDFIFSPNLSHDFDIEGIFSDNDFLVISPQAGLNAGSQNYYAGYLEKKNRISKKVANAVNAAYNSYYDALGQFKLLDYEITAPIVYKNGHFRFSFTPTYTFAQNNLPQSTAAEKAITKSIESGSPYKSSIFYFSVGVSLKF
ncbi:hypothetical protein BDD43_1035 [Mucilaginibacter gracilis]|uniref:Outer membrane protein with beta-barrel domain n=1 Tax=Mucilaginibacter gracilis TaxID=423350 RepID=A0A495IXV2_9SPHI|nr:hypothetical protein [Mucilaginibacter gracilis]RKR80898.1 hypothetical protein BDD43_1035 [Mucilaginibacter gracilis]